MMERSFQREIQALRLGAGATFRGEGILAVTKALLQSGVSYVGGYQGAPVSHLLDVMVEAQDLLAELGVHVETCSNEAAAAAMLGASINYPLRGAVTWKSIVGTNVAADALSNLSSPGVIGGALIILGEDYGEGASVIQERSYAFAMKSSIWLLDPRPELATIVRMVEEAFELSEASHAPVMLELRIRACHLTGAFAASDNRPGSYSGRHRLPGPPRFDYARLAHPPLTFVQERRKVEDRLPAALEFIRARKLNEMLAGDVDDVGIIVMGGLVNGVLRALDRLDLADCFGATRIPMLVLNVVYPLVPDEVRAFCSVKRAVLVVEEGFPNYIEQAINVELRHADLQTRVLGKGPLPKAGEYRSDVLLKGLADFFEIARPARLDADLIAARVRELLAHKTAGAAAVGALPPRPPTFCTGCPERPVFSAIKLMQRELGPTHVSADIGCHSFATFPPFSLGNSILGYGMSLASAAAVGPNLEKRPIAVMGDGGFWHNGLVTGVTSHLFNKGDGVLVIMQNGYASATGLQWLPSSRASRQGAAPGMDIERTLRALGVRWLRTVRSYSVATMVKTLKQAMRSAERGLKVIIADGECQLARQRRVRAEDADRLARGQRVVRTRYGVDDALCTPLLHPPVRLPFAHREAQPGSPAPRPGCHRDRKLRRLRLMRRGRTRRRALPLLLPRRDDPQSECLGPPAECGAAQDNRLAGGLPCRPGQGRQAADPGPIRRSLSRRHGVWVPAFAGTTIWYPPHHHAHRRAWRRGRRRAHPMDRARRRRPRPPGAKHLHPGRGPTHRRDHLLPRALAASRRHRTPAGAGAPPRGRRHRSDGRERIDGGGAHGCRRFRHARPHPRDCLDRARPRDGREDRHERRPSRPGDACADARPAFAPACPARHGRDRAPRRQHDQRRDVGRDRRQRSPADHHASIRSGDPR
jgi:indolepyruvate ferredoxin oxidoreductase alpha subunit